MRLDTAYTAGAALASLLTRTEPGSAPAAPSSLIQTLVSYVPGAVVKDGNFDIASSVCNIFKPGNSFGSALASVFGSPYQPGAPCEKDTSGGSGAYKAKFMTDASLPGHTIYAPITPPPAGVKMPVVVWGNGACFAMGLMFENFFTELASHGFLVIANGGPTGFALSSYADLLDAIRWVRTNTSAVQRYGSVDTERIAVAGQSCGGAETYSAVLDQASKGLVKLAVMFNSGDFPIPFISGHVKDWSVPIAYFLGGPTDIAQKNGLRDYSQLASNVPALVADVDVGHIGTYYQIGGGKLGKAGTDFFKWKLQGDESLRPLFCDPAPTSKWVAAGFNITSKNGMC